jgi:hypothetical protein
MKEAVFPCTLVQPSVRGLDFGPTARIGLSEVTRGLPEVYQRYYTHLFVIPNNTG